MIARRTASGVDFMMRAFKQERNGDKRSPLPSSPIDQSRNRNARHQIQDETIKDVEAYEEYKKFMKIAKMQNVAATQHKPVFHSGGNNN